MMGRTESLRDDEKKIPAAVGLQSGCEKSGETGGKEGLTFRPGLVLISKARRHPGNQD